MFFEILFISLIHSIVCNSNIIQTNYGPIEGYTKGDVQYFKGVPFAAPPIGLNRFRPPQPLKSWTKVLKTRHEGHICPQIHSLGPVELGNEDCLYLDIYKPADQSLTNLPIMVWIFGGGWVLGDKYEFGFYDATNLVKNEPHIHIAMNYRVGVLGFLSLPELFKESNTTGNYALLDQVEALKWVQKNAKVLGGDPSKVTIFGESAGGISICWHLVSPQSKGLFSSAIIESGNCDSGVFFVERKHTDAFSDKYAESVGCPNNGARLDCLRNLKTTSIFGGNLEGPAALSPVMPWAAAIDSVVLSDIPQNLIFKKQYNKVPIIIGTNNNEGDIFVPLLPLIAGVLFPLTKSSAMKVGEHFWNETITLKMLDIYQHLPTYEDVFSQAITDWMFACPARRLSHLMFENKNPTWLYHWTFLPDNWIDDRILGDYHTSEIEYVYGNAWPPLIHWFDSRDKKMVQTMQNYWLSFAKYGNPNKMNPKVFWETFDFRNETTLRLDLPLSIETFYQADVCDELWDHVKPVNYPKQ